MNKKNKLNTNHPDSLMQNIKEARRTQQSLPFKKMDDFSRRQFIQTFGSFLAAMSVPSFLRFETMSNLSKKLFGSSTAFAQGAGAQPFKMLYYWRSGHGINWASATHKFHSNSCDNKSWGDATMSSHPTSSGLTLELNPHADYYAPDYVNSMLFLGNVASSEDHGAFSASTMTRIILSNPNPTQPPPYEVKFELCAATAKTQFDAGLGSLIPTPIGFYDPLTIRLVNTDPILSSWAPTQHFQLNQLLNNFTAPIFETGNGTQMSDALINKFLAVARGSFEDQFKRSLYKKDAAIIDASNEHALASLALNFRNALDLNHPSNAAAKVALNDSLPAVPTVSGNSLLINTISEDNSQIIDPQAVVFAMIMGYSLGLLPGVATMCRHASDPHGDVQLPTGPNDLGNSPPFGDARKAIGVYTAREMFNVFEWINNSGITNPAGTQLIMDTTNGGEFSRGLLLNDSGGTFPGGNENLDGSCDPVFLLTSEKNTQRMKVGSVGGYETNSRLMIGFNAATNTHSVNAPIYTMQQAFAIKCAYFGVDPTMFGVTVPAVPTGLLS